MSSSKRKNKRPQRRKRPDQGTPARTPPQVNQADQQRNAGRNDRWRFIALILVVALPLLGFWVYLKWSAQQIAQQIRDDDQERLAQNIDRNESPRRSALDWMKGATADAWDDETSQTASWNEIDDASQDGWQTEVLANQVTEQLGKLKKFLLSADADSEQLIAKLATDQLSVQPIRPEDLVTAFRGASLHVQRAPIKSDLVGDQQIWQGKNALIAMRQDMQNKYRVPAEVRAKFKVFRVERQADAIVTHQSVEFFGETDQGLLEEHIIWRARWQPTNAASEMPLLKSLVTTEYESARRQGGVMFADCTESVLTADSVWRRQLLQGYNHWLDRSQFRRFFSIVGNPGIAIGDVNGDGLEDLYLCQESGLPNRLFIQNADGTLKDVSRQAGVDWLQCSRSALVIDLDNDGHNDLSVAVRGGIVLARGDGQGRFRIQQVLDTGDDVMVLTAADYDLDGRLDLYAGTYYPDGVLGDTEETAVSGGGSQFIYYDANIGGQNSLFRNEIKDGQWSFVDVTGNVGLDTNNRRYSLAAAWEDFDNDGDQDLYVANDYGLNNLYRNDLQQDGSRQFVDIAVRSGAEDSASGMSVTWGDYDRDGWMDLYISNMFSNAGNRIAFQDQFKSEASDDIKQRFQRFARGNTLLRNPGPPPPDADDDQVRQFQDRSLQAGVNRGRWAWASSFVDINNDGWEDLVVANGYITTDDTGDL